MTENYITHIAFYVIFFHRSLEFSLDVWEAYCVFICFLYSADKFKADDQSFLFILKSPSGTQTIKLPAKPSGDRQSGGILCRTRMGPCFGHDYFNVKVIDAVRGTNYLPVENFAFICPSNLTPANFIPERDFNISEMEVFKVNFE